MKSFYYRRPSSLEEACKLLKEPAGQVKALAGGTDLLVATRLGKISPSMFVSLRDIPGLSFIHVNPEKEAVIAAMTVLEDVEYSGDIIRFLPAVAEAASFIGSPQVRTRATVGGNLCNAAPSADMAPILIAFDATVVLADSEKERNVKLEDFFTGPGETVLAPGELMKEIHIPFSSKPSFGKYFRVERSKIDCALVGLALRIELAPEADAFENFRVVLGAVGPTPIRAKDTENLLSGKHLTDKLIMEAADSAMQEAKPISDVRSTEVYRRHMVGVLMRQALGAARSWAEEVGKS
jgi:aerobic carbon-monoxide dehydrogenase medium subunit